MNQSVFLLSIPGLRPDDLSDMENLQALVSTGESARLTPSFPCVTWPVQANMLCGSLPQKHGITANGFFWRDTFEVEMWTAWNEKVQQPQIWDLLANRGKKSAVWFPMLSKGCGAETVCMPAPVHNPDGTESLWCYTKPKSLYGELLEKHGHFPLHNFWGPQANIASSRWIIESALTATERFRPDFFYIYLPHLDYAAQRSGPDSEEAKTALRELDALLDQFFQGVDHITNKDVLWLVASEYAIVPVNHVSYPNRVLRDAGFLNVYQEDGEWIDFRKSRAWALVDHQFSHIYLQQNSQHEAEEIARLFRDQPGIDEVLVGDEKKKYGIDHLRSGEIILISAVNSWQAYYYWNEDEQAPAFARSVDIHRKPGYDPVELFFDHQTKSIPLDATLVSGSHGAPVQHNNQQGLFASSQAGLLTQSGFEEGLLQDREVCRLVLDQF